MIILATISDMLRVAVVLNLSTGEARDVPVRSDFSDPAVVDRPPCRPFGITWRDDELYIANNKQLLVYDRALEYLRTETCGLHVNTHQLAYHSGYVWAASPWTNSLIGLPTGGASAVEFDPFSQSVKNYVYRPSEEKDDVSHINSLLWADDSLFVAAHNLGKESFILRYSAGTFRLDSISYDVGLAIHGLAYDRDELFWISTGTNEIRSDKGFRFSLKRPGFARGLALTTSHIVVAVSERRSRHERTSGDAYITVIDRHSNTVTQEYHLAQSGSVNDLRIMDEHDFAHGLAPFWPVGHEPGFTREVEAL